MPTLRTLVERHNSDSFTLIGINTGDSEETFRSDSKKMEVTWTCAYQGEGSTPIADL